MSGALLTLASPFLRNAASEDARRFTALLTVYLLPDSDAGVNRVGVYPEIPDDDPVLFPPFPVLPDEPSIIFLSLSVTLYAILNTFP